MFTQNITSTKMSLFTGNHVEKNRRCCDSMRCCTIATMDYGTDPISSFMRMHPWPPGSMECWTVYQKKKKKENTAFLMLTAVILKGPCTVSWYSSLVRDPSCILHVDTHSTASLCSPILGWLMTNYTLLSASTLHLPEI